MTTHPNLSDQITAAERRQEPSEAKKIKVYDLSDLFLNELNLKPFHYDKVAVFEGDHGIILAEHEAVHMWEHAVTDTVEIKATPVPESSHIYACPTHVVTISIKELLQAPYVEMTMEDFFDRRDYNPRCEQNFSLLTKHLGEIGFDLNGHFPTEKAPVPSPHR